MAEKFDKMTDNVEESKRNSFTEPYTRTQEHKMTSRSRKIDYNYKKIDVSESDN